VRWITRSDYSNTNGKINMTTKIDTMAFRDMATALRQRTGWNVARLNYSKGVWQLGRDKAEVGGTSWVTRPDWMIHGYVRWFDGKITDHRLGYVADRFIPPPRAELGDFDQEQWAIWNRGRDPWELGWTLSLYNSLSFEEVIWTTNTLGGRDCLAALLNAFADRVDSNPADGKILPITELGSSSYHHANRGDIRVPVLDIVGWAVPPAKPRPPLPAVEPQAAPAPGARIPQDLDDQIPF